MTDLSPLFAVQAEQMLLAGMPEEAIDICELGLETFPKYPAALNILAKAYLEHGDSDKAESIIQVIMHRFPNHKSKQFLEDEVITILKDPSKASSLHKKIEEAIVETSSNELNRSSKLTMSSLFNIQFDNFSSEFASNKKALIPGIEFSPFHQSATRAKKQVFCQQLPALPAFPNSVSVKSITTGLVTQETEVYNNNWTSDNHFQLQNPDDFLASIAQKLNNISIPEVEEDFIEDDEDNSPPVVVTDTIANLLSLQGKSREAIDAYTQLSTVYPEKLEMYEEKISKLKEKL